MNDIDPDLQQNSAGGLLVMTLYVLAAFCATAGLVVGIWRAFQEPALGQSPAASVMAGLLTLGAGFVAAAILWAMTWLIHSREESLLEQRQLLRAVRRLQQTTDAPSDALAAASPTEEELLAILKKIREEIGELNTNTLLTAEQREAKRLRKQSQRAEQLSRQVALAIREGNYEEAEEFLERLSHEIPDDPHLDELRDRIDEGQREEVRRIVQQQVRRTSDLMAVARFDEAVQVAREVEQQHGSHPEADGLLERVKREAETYELEQRRRLFSQINAYGEARQWKLALETAHRLLETYPDSSQAEQVRGMMPTIVDNARIEEVRGLRDRILDLMERRRYEEAVNLAKHVVNNYPETAAAEELREKMPRLEELAFRQKNENGQG